MEVENHFPTPYQIESDGEMIDSTPLFLRTVCYNCESGNRKTTISTLGSRHEFTLDTSNLPIMPFIDGFAYLKRKEDQIRYIERHRENPAMPDVIIIEAEIITLKQYNEFYLKNGSINGTK